MKELTTLKEIREAVKFRQSFCVSGKYAKAISKLKVFQKRNRSIIASATTVNFAVTTSTISVLVILTIGVLLAFAIAKNYEIVTEIDPDTKKVKTTLTPTQHKPS